MASCDPPVILAISLLLAFGAFPALEMQLFKEVLERGSGYKIFRYYDEDPELVTDEDPALVGDPSPGGGS